MSKILCFMDFEYTTSGDKRLDFRSNKIELLSIGAVFVDSETGLELEHFYEVVKPKKNTILSPYCSELTRLTQEEVNNAREMADVVDDFVKVSKKYKEIDYFVWGTFDYVALRKSVRITKYTGEFINVIKRLKNAQPRISKSIKYKKEVLYSEWGLQKIKKAYMMKESENQHNALYDARDLKDVYYAYKRNAKKDKEYLEEIYKKKLLEREQIIQRGLKKHDKYINDLWDKIKESNIHRVKNIDKGEFKKLINNIEVEHRGLESIGYHEKTISVLKTRNTKSATIGERVSGYPLTKAKQYRYSELEIEIYPKVKKEIELKKDTPSIEVRVFANDEKIFSIWIEVNQKTKKTITNFINAVFFGVKK